MLGTVIEVTIEGLLAKGVLAIGVQHVTALITSDAARELALKPGDSAVALVKATEVMIAKSPPGDRQAYSIGTSMLSSGWGT